MPDLKSGKDCCGCTACSAICPHNAIEMQPDQMGFRYPKVDLSKCVECKLCEKVCSFNDGYDLEGNYASPEVWGVRLKNEKELMKSRSGGAFVAFSDWILENGGVVYGAGFKEHFVVAHRRATTKEERDSFRGSKYVQSDLDGIFRQVKRDLMAGLKVMFVGTACQTSALRSYINKRLQENLWVVDIICHGVPSPYYWRDNAKYLEKRNRSEIEKVIFRDKSKFGWNSHVESYKFKNGKILFTTAYTYILHQDMMLRESCENCHFCNVRRPSDLTLGDFWGWERTGSKINEDNKGISLVFINSEKGRQLFYSVSDSMELVAATLEQCMQTHLQRPVKRSKMSDQFREEYLNRGFKFVYNKYGDQTLEIKIKRAILRFVSPVKEYFSKGKAEKK